MYHSLWVNAVATVMLTAPWKTRKAGASCLSRAIEMSPELAMFLLDCLEAIQKKVCVVCALCYFDDIIMTSQFHNMQGDFPPKPFLSLLLSLAMPTHPKKEEVALHSLIIAHHHLVGEILAVKREIKRERERVESSVILWNPLFSLYSVSFLLFLHFSLSFSFSSCNMSFCLAHHSKEA